MTLEGTVGDETCGGLVCKESTNGFWSWILQTGSDLWIMTGSFDGLDRVTLPSSISVMQAGGQKDVS